MVAEMLAPHEPEAEPHQDCNEIATDPFVENGGHTAKRTVGNQARSPSTAMPAPRAPPVVSWRNGGYPPRVWSISEAQAGTRC